MIKIAIVEDEEKYKDVLVNYLGLFSKEKDIEFEINWFDNGFAFLEATDKILFDLVLMDIMLPDCDGLEISRRFRLKNIRAVLIFVTNMAQYAIYGYDVDALDFLVKPVTYENFQLKINKAVRSVKDKAKQNNVIAIKSKEGQNFVNISDIVYIESFQHKMEYHMRDETKYTVLDSMKNITKQLPSNVFCNCHKSYLVNLLYVNQITSSMVVLNYGAGTARLPVGRVYKAEFMNKLLAFNKGV